MREGAEALTLSILTGHSVLGNLFQTPNTHARNTFLPPNDGRKHVELRNYMEI
jgi:hypothetical protein